ncbi:GH15 family glucan-1,4-alpha-glucosidase [Catalinimonas alkaloidigena]|uniref:glycoside hydrolase family 15 protein n=1 Tax=Catalinimonas alkaloidigena TaxID=1075417 RepID=UPI002406F91A|nr:glycoside hydrolase family 15 protein [Catalinimonas alkaloidigena]MDF9798426.1 GH15 family glucan-1,4-alpha-glucosidase [Catalinimonas alkaloidigena]
MKNQFDQDYMPIDHYGIIGNQHTVALVGNNGSIDFMCFPRFDSPSIFASILDSEKGGHFSIQAQMEDEDFKQQYLPDTNVLLTRFLAYEGMVEITDFMPVKEMEHNCTLVRKVTVIRGEVDIKMDCAPRFNYAQNKHKAKQHNKREISFSSTHWNIRLLADVDMKLENGDAQADFTLKEKESVSFILEAMSEEGDKEDEKRSVEHYVDKTFQETNNFWKNWVAKSNYRGMWKDMMNRSALTLKLLTSYQFGAPVAAPTFGLPERVGGERNWDYRYTWIRDAAFTMYAFIRMGFTYEAGEFMKWIRTQFEKNVDNPNNLQLMYSVDGESDLHETELNHLEGYKQSKPVRVGNGAYNQLQLDIYGELMDSIYLYDKYGEPITYDFWERLTHQINFVCDHWQKKDHGIWEIRSETQEFIYSRVMCWVAVDRAVRLAEKRSFPYPWKRWRKVRDEIYHDIYNNFWNEGLQSFVQHKGSEVVDASVLLMPLVRFISPYDPRWVSTLEVVEKELVTDTLVYRYNNQVFADGLEGSEGTFSMCSFWYVECLARGGQLEKARLFFEKMLGYGNHLGLFAEQIGLRGEQLGNFPQAFTHLGLISAAFALNRGLNGTH